MKWMHDEYEKNIKNEEVKLDQISAKTEDEIQKEYDSKMR